MKQILTFVSLLFLLTNCVTQEADQLVFESANKILHNKSVRYEYRSHWDNRFNQTIFQDSAKVIYSQIPNAKKHYFGFYVDYGNSATLFDGFQMMDIEHKDKLIVVSDSSELRTNFFKSDYHSVFSSGPLELLSSDIYDTYIDTTIDNTKYVIGRNTKISSSKSDSTQTITNDDFYYFNRITKLLDRKKAITIREGDTLQIIDTYFSNYQFDTIPFDFSTLGKEEWQNYSTVAEDDLDNESHLKQIQVDDKLAQKTYKSIENEPIDIFGKKNKKTVIMFSFIGCAACEVALTDFKNRNYQFKSNIDFYYSSPQDNQQSMLAYAKKKQLPFAIFSKETQMNTEFNTYFFPTFVVINENGIVEDIHYSYGESVLELLFD